MCFLGISGPSLVVLCLFFFLHIEPSDEVVFRKSDIVALCLICAIHYTFFFGASSYSVREGCEFVQLGYWQGLRSSWDSLPIHSGCSHLTTRRSSVLLLKALTFFSNFPQRIRHRVHFGPVFLIYCLSIPIPLTLLYLVHLEKPQR
jgi:hypothetical protein